MAALSAKLGLDRPAGVRYVDWMKGLATGELGASIAYDTPIAQLVGERLIVTVPLALMAMALTTVLAFSLGLFAARATAGLGDVGVMGASQVGIALPNFWFAILLIWLFAVKLRCSRPGDFRAGARPMAAASPGLRALVLPARRARGGAGGDPRPHRPLGGARRAARGLRPHRARQGPVAARRALGPRAEERDGAGAHRDGAAVRQPPHRHRRDRAGVSLPGLGRLVFQAIANRDLLVVRNVVMLLAAAVVVINFAVDVLYVVIDPRLRARARTT